MTSTLGLVVIAYAVASVATFVAYGVDKRRARSGERRISERTLHLFELFGGWPGALVAQQMFRHKRRKARYVAVFVPIVMAHLALWGGFLYR